MVIRNLLLLLSVLLSTTPDQEPKLNGFTLSNLLIPLDEIHLGGPEKDGIPALDHPMFETSSSTKISNSELVIGLVLGSEAKAYPISILNWHEIVNDIIAEKPVLITYCPLCGSGVVFERKSQIERLFGVSGLLYNSDVLMYDRETQSLWSQLESKAISGPAAGQDLTIVPSQIVTWERWKLQYPNTTILSTETGHKRNYQADPYSGYQNRSDLFFPVNHMDKNLPSKARVLGVSVGNKSIAFPIQVFRATTGTITYSLQGESIVIGYDKRSETIWVESPSHIVGTSLYWFAWKAFYPDTEIYKP